MLMDINQKMIVGGSQHSYILLKPVNCILLNNTGSEKTTIANNISKNPEKLWFPGIIIKSRMLAMTRVKATKFERMMTLLLEGGSSFRVPLSAIRLNDGSTSSSF